MIERSGATRILAPIFQTQKGLDCTAKANDGFVYGIRPPTKQSSTDGKSGKSTKSPYRKAHSIVKKTHERQVAREKRD